MIFWLSKSNAATLCCAVRSPRGYGLAPKVSTNIYLTTRHITAPTYHGTNSLWPYPCFSLFVFAPDAVASIN